MMRAALLLFIPYLHVVAFTSFATQSRNRRFSTAGRIDSGRLTPLQVGQSQTKTTTSSGLNAAIREGDTVLVVGGTGGVGQLVTKKLQSRGNYSVRVTSRNKERGEETIADEGVDVAELDLVNGSDADLEAALKDVSAVVVSVGTTAFPTLKWKGGNTPEAIDKIAVARIAKAAAKGKTTKKVVLLTSIGVDRTKQMPFLILNLFGVLDAKKSGEDAMKAASAEGDFDYVIIRPGRLIGGPFTNLDVAKLLQVEGGAENGVDVAAGDTLLGDCKRDACAEAVVQCLINEDCKDVAFAIMSNENKALNDQQWSAAFQQMRAQ
jgi:nucleoside-diphosphate-sugar epimerase